MPSIARLRYKNHTADFDSILTWSWFIGPIRSNDSPMEPSRFNVGFMTVSLATACFARSSAALHFVSCKLKKTAAANRPRGFKVTDYAK
jgi:hypothetical protein